MAEFKVVELEDLKEFFGIDFEKQLNQTAYANAGIESYSFTLNLWGMILICAAYVAGFVVIICMFVI